MKTLLTLLALASLSLATAHAQIGWTLEQCRKHWGRESSIEHHYLDESHTATGTTYIFGSKIQKEVNLDAQGKVNDVLYIGPSKPQAIGSLNIDQLLAMEKEITWAKDPILGETSRHAYWIGYKDGVAVFRARYFLGKRDPNGHTWGESLEVAPIESEAWSFLNP